MRWLPIVLVVAACDPMPTRTLAELPEKKVSLRWGADRGDPGVHDVYLSLDYQLDECVAVDATAKIDGKRLDVVSRGWREEDQRGTYCAFPGWSMYVPSGGDPAAASTIEIEDETATITFELTNPFAERTIQASTGGSLSVFPAHCSEARGMAGELVLPPGQEVTLSWSPATDTLRHGVISGFSASSESVFSLYDPNLTMEGSTIRFVAPANARQAARAEIEGSYVPPILRCEGAVACSASNEYCSKFAVR